MAWISPEPVVGTEHLGIGGPMPASINPVPPVLYLYIQLPTLDQLAVSAVCTDVHTCIYILMCAFVQ